jgi:hypothetical protein
MIYQGQAHAYIDILRLIKQALVFCALLLMIMSSRDVTSDKSSGEAARRSLSSRVGAFGAATRLVGD